MHTGAYIFVRFSGVSKSTFGEKNPVSSFKSFVFIHSIHCVPAYAATPCLWHDPCYSLIFANLSQKRHFKNLEIGESGMVAVGGSDRGQSKSVE